MPLLVTGTVGIDTVETPSGRAERVLGGSCAYFAAAASFHAPVRVVAAVGRDWPEKHRSVLRGFKNVDLRGLEVRANSTTFAWHGRYKANMNDRETLSTHLGVLDEKPPAIPQEYADSDFIFLANTHPAVQLEFLRHFPKRRLAVADTMDLWIKIARKELEQLLKEVDGVVLNYSEAEQLTGVSNAVTACRRILEMGPAFAVNKKGEHGAILVHRDGVATMPAYPAELHQVVDPTGAGDSFAGGMMGYLASVSRTDVKSLQTAIAWGTVTASFTIESYGLDRLAQIKRSDIDARMKLFQAAARVG
ncbi:MAG: PfkB family carbohydrate kinase [Phycisphaerales bacterium]|nr:PfkB family carbohydrate kinase [Phycisphaerales bacterium]MCI0631773.1 PfkB family carbohydrate kinase [Phycisphaerales bacterium]MCI0676338.1 PfkB family carbohydrate kinase [Phycisphaerales bacterium]